MHKKSFNITKARNPVMKIRTKPLPLCIWHF